MKLWHLHHEYSNYFINQLLDPDFDELGGELTLAQIRDPVLTWAQTWKPPVSPTGGDPLAYVARMRVRIEHQYRQLDYWAQRFEHAFKLRVSYKQKRLRLVYKRLQAAQKNKMVYDKTRLQRLSQRFYVAGLPQFRFISNQPCNRCVPYNGHFTINYWATGQKDCW